MKFYIITDNCGTVFDCTTSLAEAKTIARAEGVGNTITRLDVDVSSETIRQLLGEMGGYAKSIKNVFTS